MTEESITARASGRRERERRARLQLICDAGVQVFARHGYKKATMAMVARQAELGKASLYYYFPTKRELFARIVEDGAEEMARLVDRSIPDDAPPIDIIEAILRNVVGFFRARPDIASLHLPLIAAGPERLEELVGERVAAKVAAAHAPMMRHLSPLGDRLPGGAAMPQVLSSFVLGAVTKLAHGGGDELDAELELLLHLLRTAQVAATRGSEAPC